MSYKLNILYNDIYYNNLNEEDKLEICLEVYAQDRYTSSELDFLDVRTHLFTRAIIDRNYDLLKKSIEEAIIAFYSPIIEDDYNILVDLLKED